VHSDNVLEHCIISYIISLTDSPASNRVPIGVEDRKIPDYAISASTRWDKYHAAYYGRLNNVKRGHKRGGWSAKRNTRGQWIQVFLGRQSRITAILTQGRQDIDQWVTSYTVAYSNNGRTFRSYKGRGGRAKVFFIYIFICVLFVYFVIR